MGKNTALVGGFAALKILKVHGRQMVKRTFESGFRTALHQKDVNLALFSARAWGVAHGGNAWSHSAMVKALENMATLEIGRQLPDGLPVP